MKNNVCLYPNNEKVLHNLLFILVTSTYFQKYFIDAGFALKPFMIVLALTIYLYIILNLKVIMKVFLYEKLFLIFLVYSFIRGLSAQDFTMFSRMSINLVIVCVLYFFTSNLVCSVDKKKVISILFNTGVIFTGGSLVLYILGAKGNELGGIYEGQIYRLTGTIVDPNIFGIFISLIYGLSLYGISKKKKRYYLSLALSVTVIFLTFSRGTILGTLFCTIICIMSFKLLTINRLINIVLILIMLVFVFAIVGEELIYEKMGIDLLEIVEIRMSDNTGTGRLGIWKNGIKMFMNNPIYGVGLYNFQYYNIKIFNDNHYMHNTFLEVFVENGIIGGILFICSIILLILNKTYSDEDKILKRIIYTQLFMLIFLTGISNEFLYLTLGVYKGFLMKYKHEYF